jgi:2-(1,2-epoxy-1,2-dihydrophenyl)acetyl-CoA isomerase
MAALGRAGLRERQYVSNELELDVRSEDGVTHVLLNRPERRNALNAAMVEGLIDLLEEQDRSSGSRVIVIRGAGGNFCSGMDLEQSNKEEAPPRIGHLERRINDGAHRLIRVMNAIQIPIVTVVEGWAAGMGNAVALSGDYVIASETARFWVPFVGRGFSPDSGSTWMMQRLVGIARAKDMIMRARPIESAEAASWGLINVSVQSDRLEEVATEIIGEFARAATFSVGLAKQLIAQNADASLAAALRNEAMAEELSVRSADFKEGMKAFNEHRSPDFQGR